MSDIRVYHSFRSPYSRLGLHIVNEAGLDVDLIAFTGPPEGIAFSDPAANPLKLAYYALDAPRMTLRRGLAIKPPDPFEVDYRPSNKALTAAVRDGFGLPFALAVSDARWGAGENISDISVIKKCAQKVGWFPDAVGAAQTDPSIKDMMADQRKLIAEDGVFGVPFAVYGANKYWGHERFDLLVEDAKG